VGDEFDILRETEVARDPETGEILGKLDKKIGKVKIRFIKANHFSIGEILSNSQTVNIGDLITISN